MSRFLVALSGLMFLVLVPIGCVHKSGPLPEPEESEIDRPNTPLYLTGLRLDRDAVRNGSKPLFDEPPAGEHLGETRRARGYISIADNGLCRIEVRAGERVIGMGGSITEQRYDLLVFVGRLDAPQQQALTSGGDRSGLSYNAAIDEVRLNWINPNQVEIRAFSVGRPQAYVYVFERRTLKDHDVNVPY